MSGRLTALVSGRVQGVGFRDWVRQQAEALRLGGSARNLPDGRVEVIAVGPKSACEALLTGLRSGSTPGAVDAVDEDWTDVADDVVGFRTL